MHEARRPGVRQLARRDADRLGVEPRFLRRPLRRAVLDFGGELVEAVAVLLDERTVVAVFGDEHVAPGEHQREIGAGPDRQPVLRLARRDREARIDDDDGDASLDRLRELLHLRVVHVLAQVLADQGEAVRVRDVDGLGRAEAGAECQREADIAWPAALRERRAGEIDRPPGLERVLDEELANAVVEHRDGLGAVLRLDLVHPLGDVGERLVPGDRGPFLLAARAAADQRLLQAVGVVVRADGTGAARAQPAAALRIARIALELPELPVADMGEPGAAPEAHFTERGGDRDGAGGRVGGASDT